MNNDVAVIVGNGLSIAFSPELKLQTITENVLERIVDAEGEEVVSAMQKIAQRVLPSGANTDEDFEVLVGAFGAESLTLGFLGMLAELTQPDDVRLKESIVEVKKYAEKVRDTGVSHVLEVITESSNIFSREKENKLDSLMKSIINSFNGKVVISNLNYDTILLNALIRVCRSELADLADGRCKSKITVLESGREEEYIVPNLRKDNDFPLLRRVHLLHLHGSISYWKFDGDNKDGYVKMTKEILNKYNLWKKIRDGEISIRPVVVLANRRDKADHIERYPFDLAYEAFANSLKCEKWIIVGYSFRDDPVNNMLRSEFLDRKRENKPRVLVVTYGGELKLRDVEKAFGWGVEDGSSSEWLTINREGASDMENTEDWVNFVSD